MTLAAAVRSELTKQFSTAAWWILAIVLAGYVGLVSAGFALALTAVADGSLGGADGPPIAPEALPPVVYSVATSFGYVLALLIGALIVTSEYRHQTLTPTFLAVPRRGRALAAKVVVAVVLGLLYGLLATAASVGPGAAVLASSGLDTALADGDTWAMLGRMLLAFVLWALVGLGVGTLVRHQVTAIVLVLVFTQFVEPVLRLAGGFVEGLAPVVRVLPGAAADALVGASALSIAGASAAEPLHPWAGGLVLAGYAVAFLVLGLLLSWRRDVN